MNGTVNRYPSFKSAIAASMALHALVLLGILGTLAGSEPRLIMADGDGLVHVSLVSSDRTGPGQAQPARTPREAAKIQAVPVTEKSSPEAARERVRVEYASLATGQRADTGNAVAVDLAAFEAAGDGTARGAGGAGVPGPGKGEKFTQAVPRYSENPRPRYPELARVKGFQGIVLLAAEVSAEGRVDDVRVKRTSGYALLDRSAAEAVRKWKFEPGRRMGVPVAMWVDIPVRFVLGEESP